MDIPVHIAAAAVTCQTALYLDAQVPSSSRVTKRTYLFSAGCFAMGTLSHLGLDLIPHYDVLYKIGNAFKPEFLPGILWTGLKVGILAFPIILWFLFLTTDHSKFAFAALIGGLYPDFEKGAYLATLLPRSFVLFPFHSCSYSPAGWEVEYRSVLIAAEIGLLFGLFVLMYRFGQQYRVQYPGPNSSFREWCREIRQSLISFTANFLEKIVCRFSVRQVTMLYLLGLVTIFVLSDAGWFQYARAELNGYVPQTWINHFPSRLPHDDKMAHFFLIGLLALLANMSFRISFFKIACVNILKGSLFVFIFVTIEKGSQVFFSARSCSWGDLMANYLGIICSDLLLRYFLYQRQAGEKRLPTMLTKMMDPQGPQYK
ncbi:MAG: hypothetical protein RBT80_04895 [Candidatus Vecturithrix sp.]|nr:hypothetical protein [Candidatus Vecturithrix sp.]